MDITERETAKANLHESQERYIKLFDENHLAMLLIDPDDGIILDANQAAIAFYGWGFNEIIRKNISDIHVLPKNDITKEINHAKAHQRNHFFFQHRLANGQIRDVEVYTSSIVAAGHHLLYATIRDITDQKRMESERRTLENRLRQAQKLEAVGTMVGGISHEFNNILQSIFLYTDLLKDELNDDKSLQMYVQRLQDEGTRARDIVQQILTFSRKTKIAMQPRAIHELVLEALLFERSSLPPNIEIDQNINVNCGMVVCDKTQVHQIIINLCNNAEHAMGAAGGTLTVTLHQIRASLHADDNETDVVELKISDTGSGMDAETLSRVFDPFFTTKEVGKGTGLGLSVIHGIVEMMNGQISVKSKPGEGTTFLIQFPVANEYTEDVIKKQSVTGTLDKKTILLVDDEENICETTQNFLRRKGLVVDNAVDGIEGLELFRDTPNRYDLVVTDLSMPNLSGADLTKEIRRLNVTIPIILSTGQLGIEDKKEFLEIGITDFIQKPWTVTELIEHIQSIGPLSNH